MLTQKNVNNRLKTFLNRGCHCFTGSGEWESFANNVKTKEFAGT